MRKDLNRNHGNQDFHNNLRKYLGVIQTKKVKDPHKNFKALKK